MSNIGYAFLIAFVYHMIFNIDYYIGWQTLMRPIAAGAITGAILGDFRTGLIMGATLEAIYMGISPIGGSIPSDPTAGAVLAVAFVIVGGVNLEAAIALALPIGTACATVQNLTNPIQALFAPYFDKLASEGKIKKFCIMHVIYNFTVRRIFITAVIFLAVAFGIDKFNVFLSTLPSFVTVGLNASGGMLTVVGFGILLTMVWSKEIGAFFFLGFILVKYLNLSTLPIAIIGTIVAVSIFFRDLELHKLKVKNNESTEIYENISEEEDFFV